LCPFVSLLSLYSLQFVFIDVPTKIQTVGTL
jgi:hypothetical protein